MEALAPEAEALMIYKGRAVLICGDWGVSIIMHMRGLGRAAWRNALLVLDPHFQHLDRAPKLHFDADRSAIPTVERRRPGADPADIGPRVGEDDRDLRQVSA